MRGKRILAAILIITMVLSNTPHSMIIPADVRIRESVSVDEQLLNEGLLEEDTITEKTFEEGVAGNILSANDPDEDNLIEETSFADDLSDDNLPADDMSAYNLPANDHFDDVLPDDGQVADALSCGSFSEDPVFEEGQFAENGWESTADLFDGSDEENNADRDSAAAYTLGEKLNLAGNSTVYFTFTLDDTTALGFLPGDEWNVSVYISPSDHAEQETQFQHYTVKYLDSGAYTLRIENKSTENSTFMIYEVEDLPENTYALSDLTVPGRFYHFNPDAAVGARMLYTFTASVEVTGILHSDSGSYLGYFSTNRPWSVVLEGGKRYWLRLCTDFKDVTEGTLSIAKELMPSNAVVSLAGDPFILGISEPSIDDFSVSYDYLRKEEEPVHRTLTGAAKDENGYGLSDFALFSDKKLTKAIQKADEPGTYYYRVSFARENFTGEVHYEDPRDVLDTLEAGEDVTVEPGGCAWYLFATDEEENYYYETAADSSADVNLYTPVSMELVTSLKKDVSASAPSGTYILKIENTGEDALVLTIRTVGWLQAGSRVLSGGLTEVPFRFRAYTTEDTFAWYVINVSSGYSVSIMPQAESGSETTSGTNSGDEAGMTVLPETDTLVPLAPGGLCSFIFHSIPTGAPDQFTVSITPYTPPRHVSLQAVPDLAEHFETLSVGDLILTYEDADGKVCSLSPGEQNTGDPFCRISDAWFTDDTDTEGERLQELTQAGNYTAHVQFFYETYELPVNVVRVEMTDVTDQGVFTVASTSPEAPDRFRMQMTDQEQYYVRGSDDRVRIRPAGLKDGKSYIGKANKPVYFSAYIADENGMAAGEGSGSSEAYLYVRYFLENLSIKTDETVFYWDSTDRAPDASVVDWKNRTIDPSLCTLTLTDDTGEPLSGGMIEPGKYTLKAEGLNQYTGLTDALDLTVKPFPLTSETINMTLSTDTHAYDRSAFVPTVTLTRDGKDVAAEDYQLSWRKEDGTQAGFFEEGPENAGTYLAVAAGTDSGHYNKTRTASFTIQPQDIAQEAVTAVLSETRFFYDPEKPARPQAALTFMDEELVEGTDYTLTWVGDDKIGEAGAVVKGIGNFTGSRTLPYQILDTKIPLAAIRSEAIGFTGAAALDAARKDTWYRFAADGETMLLIELSKADPKDVLFYRWDGEGEYYELDRTIAPSGAGSSTDTLEPANSLEYALLFEVGEIALCIPAGVSARIRRSEPAAMGAAKDLVYAGSGGLPMIYRLDADQDYRYVFSSQEAITVTPVSRESLSLGQISGSALQSAEENGTQVLSLDLPEGIYYYHVQPAAVTERTFTVNKAEQPEKIEGVLATAHTLQIALTWNKGIKTDTVYRVYRSRDDGEFTLAVQINDSTVTRWIDRDVSVDSTYSYYVTGVYGPYVEGPPSEATQKCSPLPDTTKPTVRTLQASKEGDRLNGTVTFTATAEDDIAVTGMRLLIRKQGEGDDQWVLLASSNTDTISATVNTAGTAYEAYGVYELTALAVDKTGNESEPKTAVWIFDNQGPDRVSGISAESNSCVSVSLQWDALPATARNEDFKGFRVEQLSADGSTWTFVSNVSSPGIRMDSLVPGTAYCWRAAAYDQLGNRGDYSDTVTLTTPADENAPEITEQSISPSDTQGRIRDQVTYTVMVEDEYAVRRIIIEYSHDRNTWEKLKDMSWTGVRQTRKMSAVLDTTDLEEGSWYLRAVATDSYGNSTDTSDEALYYEIIVDRTAPAAPQGVGLYAGDDAIGPYVEVTWDAGAEQDLAGYEVWRSSDGENYTCKAEGLQQTLWSDYDVRTGENWTYMVRAVDIAGNVSDNSKAVTTEVTGDRTPPEMYSISPAAGSRVSGINGKVSVSAAAYDNRALAAVSFYSKTGAEADYVQFARITLEKKDSGVLYASLSTEGLANGQTVYVKAQAEDREGLLSDPIQTSFVLDMSAPVVHSASARLNEEDRSVTVSWTGGGEEDLYGYYLYRYIGGSRTLVTTVAAASAKPDNTFSYTDKRIAACSGDIRYTIFAFDQLGNLSKEAQAGTVTLLPLTEDDPLYPSVMLALPKPEISCDNMMQLGVEYAFQAVNNAAGTTIAAWLYDFGDGTTSGNASPVHSYMAVGNYTVRLTVTDPDGHQVSTCKEVTVREKSTLGNVKITVRDQEGKNVADAPVYFDLGSDAQFVRYTDRNGEVVITTKEGTHDVGCFSAHYLPVSMSVLAISGRTEEYELLVTKKDLVSADFDVHRMTLPEIREAGIDVTDPDNQFVAEVTIQMDYKEQKVELELLCNAGGILGRKSQHVRLENGEERALIPCVIWNWASGFGRVGLGLTDNWGWGSGEEMAVALLDIPVGVSALKDFFDVRLHIINHAGNEFALLNNTVSLNLPKGLTLIATDHTLDSPDYEINRIGGGTTQTLEWILRGDQIGTYTLNADYAGTLDTFNARVQAHFEADEPLEVYGLSGCCLTVTIPNIISAGGYDSTEAELYYDLRLTNEGTVPAYLPALTPPKGDAFSSLMYNGYDVDTFPQILYPGDFLQVFCRMNVDRKMALYELYNYYVTTYGKTGLRVEVLSEDEPLSDNSVVFSTDGTERILRNTRVMINGIEHQTDSEGVLYLSGFNEESLSFHVPGYYDYTVGTEKVLGKNGSHKVVMRVVDDDCRLRVASVYYREEASGDKLTGKWKDGMVDSLKVLADADDSPTYTIVMEADWMDEEPGTFYLAQSEDNRISSETGVFKNVDLAEVFVPDRDIYAYVISRSGKGSKPEKTSLTVGRGDDDLAGLLSTGSFKFGGSVEVTLPDDYPVIGGNTFSLSLSSLPIYAEVDNNRVKVGINISSDDDGYNLFKEYGRKMDKLQNAGEKFAIGKKLMRKYGKQTSAMKMASDIEAEITAGGYAELEMTGSGLTFVEGRLMVMMDVKGSITKQFLQPVPFFVGFVLGAQSGATGTVSRYIADSNIPFYTELELTFEPYAKVTGGVGINKIIAVQATGGVSTQFSWKPTIGYLRIKGKSDLNIKGYIGPWTFLDQDLWSAEKILYEQNYYDEYIDEVNRPDTKPAGNGSVRGLAAAGAGAADQEESGVENSGADGLAADGSGADGLTADGSGADDSAVDDFDVDGLSVEGSGTDGLDPEGYIPGNTAFREAVIQAAYDPANYRAELVSDYQEDWLGGKTVHEESGELALDGTGERVLQTNVYPDARQSIVQGKDQDGNPLIMMVYLSQDAGRAAQNSTMAVYSVYNREADTWSVPKAVEDDGTADLYPKAVSENGQIHVIWQNTTKILDAQETLLTDLGAYSQIAEAVYDPAADTFVRSDQPFTPASAQSGEAQTIYTSPDYVTDGESTYAVWLSNDDGNIFGSTGHNAVMAAKKTAGGWSQPAALQGSLAMITDYESVVYGGTLYVAASVERPANDEETALHPDTILEMLLCSWNAAGEASCRWLTDDETADTEPSFITRGAEKLLCWNAGGSVKTFALEQGQQAGLQGDGQQAGYAQAGLQGGAAPQDASEQNEGLQTSGQTLAGQSVIEETTDLTPVEGRQQVVTDAGTYLMWIDSSAHEQYATEIYCAVFDEKDGIYGTPVCITGLNKYITSFAVVPVSDNRIHVVYQGRNIAVTSDGAVFTDPAMYSLIITPEADLKVSEEQEILNEQIYAGAVYDVGVLVENHGMFPAEGYVLQLLDPVGNVVVTREYEKVLGSGESDTQRIRYILPGDFSGGEYTVRAVIGRGVEANLADNLYTFEIPGRQMQIISVQTYRSGDLFTVITKIRNSGALKLNDVSLVISAEEDGKAVLDTVQVGQIRHNEVRTLAWSIRKSEVTHWDEEGKAKIFLTAKDKEGVSPDTAGEGDTGETVTATAATILYADPDAQVKINVFGKKPDASGNGIDVSLSVKNDTIEEWTGDIYAAVAEGNAAGDTTGGKTLAYSILRNVTAAAGKTEFETLRVDMPEGIVWSGDYEIWCGIVIPIAAITLDTNETTIRINHDPVLLRANASPSTALDTSVVWSTSNRAVAAVDQNGLVTPVSVGECVITAAASDGYGAYAQCTVTVSEAPVEGKPGENDSASEAGNKNDDGLAGSDSAAASSAAQAQTTQPSQTTQGAQNLQAAQGAQAAEASRAAAAAEFSLNVANGGSVPLQVKKKSGNVMVETIADGDSLASAVSSNSNTVQASVSGKQVVLRAGKKKGSAKVTVKSAMGGEVTFTVKVQKKKVTTKSIKVAKASINLKKGETFDLKAKLNPITSPDKLKISVNKKSKKLVTVKNGIVTGKAKGKATITIKAGKKTKKVKVTITD